MHFMLRPLSQTVGSAGLTPQGSRVVVSALGHPDRGDDAVGGRVARALRRLLPEDVPLQVHRADALSLLDHWRDCEAVVCVDAVAPMGQPGRIHRLDLSRDSLPPGGASTSSHALGLAETVALARALHLAPRRIIVYAIEGRCFDAGAPLSPPVAAAVAARAVAREVSGLRLCLNARPASVSAPTARPAERRD